MKAFTDTRYQATVYHGGNLLGLGKWATGKKWHDKERAEKEGQRMASQAKATVGGSPIIEISAV